MSTTEKGIVSIRLSEAIEKADHCFLCQLETKLEQRYISTYLSELVMDPKSRDKIVKSRGFCNYHSYKMLVSASNPANEDGLGMALILRSVVEQLSEDVKSQQKSAKLVTSKPWSSHLKGSADSSLAAKLLASVSNEVKCPACDHISGMMRIYIEEFLHEIVQNDEVWQLYHKSAGMCIPHYLMAMYIAAAKPRKELTPAIEKLIEKQTDTLEKIKNDLSEYIEKQDYRFSSEERAATGRYIGESLSKVVGRRGIERTLMKILKAKESGSS